MWRSVLPCCIFYMCTTLHGLPKEVRRGHQIPWELKFWKTVSCLAECWEPTPRLLLEQQVLFTREPSLQPNDFNSAEGNWCVSSPPAEDQFSSWIWWYRSINAALKGQEDGYEFEASLSFYNGFQEGDLLGGILHLLLRALLTSLLVSGKFFMTISWPGDNRKTQQNWLFWSQLSILFPCLSQSSAQYWATENWPRCTPALRQGGLLHCGGLALPGSAWGICVFLPIFSHPTRCSSWVIGIWLQKCPSYDTAQQCFCVSVPDCQKAP